MKVNVLGTEYTVTFKSDEDVCAAMNVQIGECGGYCNVATKEIVIANLNTTTDSEAEKDVIKKSSLRHEAVHAFLNESGLADNSNMVDWFAIQGPKIYKVWQEAGAL